MWFNETSTITNSGSLLDQWNDKSGNALHIVSAGTIRPTINSSDLNSKRTVTFDGSSKALTLSATANGLMQNQSAAWSLIVLKKIALDGGATSRIAFAWPTNVSTNTSFRLDLGSTTAGNVPRLAVRRLDADSLAALPASGALDTNWHMILVTMDYSAGDGTFYLDGAQDAQNLSLTSSGNTSNTTRAANAHLCGAPAGGQYADMTVAEWIVGTGSIPVSGDIDRLFGWAAHSWGLTSLLPSGHPYKTYAP